MKILFTTHGETMENLEDILQGQKPGRLSPEGKKQIKNLAEELKDENIDYIYTSSLGRCKITAMEVAKYHPNAIYKQDDRLMARSLGIMEGKKRNDEEWAALEGDHYSKKPKGGESLFHVWERIKFFYDDLCRLPLSSTIYICAHGETKLILEGMLHDYAIERTFQGHDNQGKIPIIYEPKKAEIVIYEFEECNKIPDLFSSNSNQQYL